MCPFSMSADKASVGCSPERASKAGELARCSLGTSVTPEDVGAEDIGTEDVGTEDVGTEDVGCDSARQGSAARQLTRTILEISMENEDKGSLCMQRPFRGEDGR